MRGKLLMVAAAAAAALTLVPGALAGGPGMVVGATEDAVRSPTATGAKAQMDLLRLAGFRGVRVTQIWIPGQARIAEADLAIVKNVVDAARLDGIEVLMTVMPFGSKTTPLTDEQQAEFAGYAASIVKAAPEIRHVIVGNEPNLNRYWLPQFNEDGTDAAAPAYERLLATTYDALKAASPRVEVIGGGVSPRGSDVPNTGRDTHSPTVFLQDLGAAYRGSGRTTPIMDALAFHPYEDNSSIAPAQGTHPRTTTIALADYGKLVSILGTAFDGTAQRGTDLPIYYDEFGVESQIPAAKASLYTGTEPTTTKPVGEATQAAYYRQALALAFCQPTVRGIFLFHTRDEADLNRWQSGVYYVDGTPKSSLGAVREAMSEVRRGVIAHCPDLHLVPNGTLATRSDGKWTLTCDIDCSWTARLLRGTKTLATRRGRAVATRHAVLPLALPHAAGRYELRVTLLAPVNPGAPRTVRLSVHAQ